MRHVLVVVPLLVLGSATVISAQSNAEQDVLRLHKEYESGLARRDASAFERLLADDYTYTPANGRVVDKASQIAFTRGNTLGNASLAFRSEDLSVLRT
jgi:hypothetical protein